MCYLCLAREASRPRCLVYSLKESLVSDSPEARLSALNVTLPPAPAPMGVYKPGLVDGKYLWLSGHGTVQADGSLIIGRVAAARLRHGRSVSRCWRRSGQRSARWIACAGSSRCWEW
jgi:hypothetical protein